MSTSKAQAIWSLTLSHPAYGVPTPCPLLRRSPPCLRCTCHQASSAGEHIHNVWHIRQSIQAKAVLAIMLHLQAMQVMQVMLHLQAIHQPPPSEPAIFTMCGTSKATGQAQTKLHMLLEAPTICPKHKRQMSINLRTISPACNSVITDCARTVHQIWDDCYVMQHDLCNMN